MVITAGKDATVKGSAVAAGQDLTIRAGDNINITSAQDQRSYDYKLKKKTFGGSSSREGNGLKITQQASAVGAGNDLVLESGKDTTVTASALNAGNDLSITGDNVTVDTAENYEYDYSKRKKSGFFADGMVSSDGASVSVGYRKEKHTKETEGVTQVISALGAGNDISITARKDATIDSATVSAGRDVTVTATENVDFKSSQDLFNRNEEHKVKQVGLTLSLKQNVTAAAKAV
ncbi:hemagglutinin repeat-containing protein, partial [Kiloniella laminariae]